jgi:hypothetical protein
MDFLARQPRSIRGMRVVAGKAIFLFNRIRKMSNFKLLLLDIVTIQA